MSMRPEEVEQALNQVAHGLTDALTQMQQGLLELLISWDNDAEGAAARSISGQTQVRTLLPQVAATAGDAKNLARNVGALPTEPAPLEEEGPATPTPTSTDFKPK
jgi:hypothetical protein